MRNLSKIAVMVIVMANWSVGTASAQKGTGEAVGAAQQAVKPEVVTLSGKLLEVKTGPCEKTTGRSPVGTHIVLETAKKEKVNVHLGPASAVAEAVKKLAIGQEITVKAFRTDKLEDQHYVAVSLSFDKTTIEFRDDALRPVWAQGGRGGQGFGWGRGQMRWHGNRRGRSEW
jgi:hypothetical protein